MGVIKVRNAIHNARILRSQATEAEKLLWSRLRRRQIENCKFRRQQPIGPFITDFVCLERNLVVELDGGHHVNQKCADSNRDSWIKKEGFKILRFWNNEVFENLSEVLETIRKHLMSPSP